MNTDKKNTPRLATVTLNGKKLPINGMQELGDLIDRIGRQSSKRPADAAAEDPGKHRRLEGPASGGRFNCRSCPGTKAQKCGPCDNPACPKKVGESSGGPSTQVSLDDVEDDVEDEPWSEQGRSEQQQDDVEALSEELEQAKTTYDQAQRTLEEMRGTGFVAPDTTGLDVNAYVDVTAQAHEAHANNLRAAKEQANTALLAYEKQKKALDEIVDTRTLLAAAEAKCKEAAKAVDDAHQNKWVDPGRCMAAMQEFQTALEEVNRLKAKESELRAAIRGEQAADLEDA